MYEDNYFKSQLCLIIKEASFFISMCISDLVKSDISFNQAYLNLNQGSKDLINMYNHMIRGNDYTIEKINNIFNE